MPTSKTVDKGKKCALPGVHSLLVLFSFSNLNYYALLDNYNEQPQSSALVNVPEEETTGIHFFLNLILIKLISDPCRP